jgi:hypothetical protein
MYMTPIGSFSGVVHLIAKRPYILAAVAVVAIAVTVPLTSPTPPSPPTVAAPPVIATHESDFRPAPQPCEVEVPEATQPGVKPRQMGNCYFNYSAPPHGKDGLGSRVDNVCKHKLDDTILYLKVNQVNITLEGNSLTGHGSIAMSRAWHVRAYLIKNGIDPNRIRVKRGLKHSRVVDLIADGTAS